MSKLINFFKNLFKKPNVQNVKYNNRIFKKDIFGNEIFSDDGVYQIKYNELNRRGYITIENDLVELDINNLTDEIIQKGIITHRTLSTKAAFGKVKPSKRKGFFHIYR